MAALRRVYRLYRAEVLMLCPAVLYLAGFFVLIFCYLGYLSLTFAAPGQPEIFPSLGNFERVFSSPEFRGALLNTSLFVLVGTPLELVAGLILALLIYRNFRFRGVVRSIFIIPLAIPAMVTAIIIYVLVDYPGGHVNHLLMGHYPPFPALVDQPTNFRTSAFFSLGISLMGKVWRDMPISMLILLAGLNTIGTDQYDAAETLGAGERQKFRYITLPLLLPSISTVLVIRSIEMWKEFIFPYFLARRHRLMGTLIEELYHDWHRAQEAAAVAVVLVLLIIGTSFALYWILHRMRHSLVRV